MSSDIENELLQMFSNKMATILDEEDKYLLPSEWAAKKRIIEGDLTANPGPWDNNTTPYLVEIMDNFSKDSNCTEFVVMKATRMGFTAAMVNVLGWIIDVSPCASRLLIPSENTLKSIMNLQLTTLIRSSNLEDKLVAVNLKDKKRKGNTTYEKSFIGGHIIGMSLNSKQAKASYAAKMIIVDEFDEVLLGASRIHDDIRTRIYDRVSTFGRKARIGYMSMPSDKKSSQVWKLFLDGDQRYYFVPCPFCGTYQRMKWQDEDGNFGFVYDLTDDGQYIAGSVAMICENEACNKKIHEKHKYTMLKNGKWQPTVVAKDGRLRSYHISALYSNFRQWDDIVQQWLMAQGDLERLQTFVKSILGEPWEDRTTSYLWKQLRNVNRGENVSSRVNFVWNSEQLASIKFITVGIDVQKRYLELQVVGWASFDIAYDLHHYKIKPEGQHEKDIAQKLAFEELRRIIKTGDWNSPYLGNGELSSKLTKYFIPAKNGIARVCDDKTPRIPHLILIDCGHNPDMVYQFCSSFGNRMVFPSRGRNKLPNNNVISFKHNDQRGIIEVSMNTDLLKLEIDNAIRNSDEKSVMINIMRNRDEAYFRGLASEHRVERNGRYYWEKNAGHQRNEILDCWVMARAALWFIAMDIFKHELQTNQPINWLLMFR